ncbi:MAG: tetratricopeptide repeat protein [Candidatus Brocadia sp.]|nr:tetratricopeptide repeat protein [Candidatus Brocadia sp.]MDG6026670.1 tetratricopeptide repeat protein [Candidatus Brocadia sp.]
MRKSGFFMKVFLVLVSLGWIDPLADKVREGNELYHRGAYDDALDKYVNARIDSPPLPQLDFNIAGTQYQRKKYDEAAQLFDKVVQSGNPEMQAKASFNMGNTLYRQGKMKEAMEYYKKAVDLADGLGYKGDESIDALKNDARYNYEFVERKIKENEQKQQQQGQDQEQNQKEQDQDQNDQQQKQDDKNNKEDQRQKEDKNEEKEQDKSQQNKQEPSPENTPESDGQNKEQQAHPDKNKQKEQQAQQPQPTPHQGQRQMSKEEAERFLDALNHAEKETRQEMRDKQRLQHKSVEKDW